MAGQRSGSKDLPREWKRVPLVPIIVGGSRAPISARMLYEVFYTDGSMKHEYGHQVCTLPGYEHFNGSKREIKDAAANLRCDLEPVMRAMKELDRAVRDACIALDQHRGIKV